MSPQLLKIIATFILIYLIFRIFIAWILPMIARWYINRFKKRFYQQNPQARQARERHRQGEVSITYTQDPGQAATNDLGEYVDFEEIKEKEKKSE